MRLPTRLLTIPALLCLLGSALMGAADPRPIRLVFVGNSYLYGSGSAVRFFRPQSVNDLNRANVGGVPAVFKAFTEAANLAYDVSLETVSGQGLDYHLAKKAGLLGRPWDVVVMSSFSMLDQSKPGDPNLLIRSARALGELFARHNPEVDVRLLATWPRADAVFPEGAPWHGKGLDGMARDVRAAYDQAAAVTPRSRGVIPVGEAWLRAIRAGFADSNPYDGVSFGQVSLWTYDHHHASTFGYYLEALMVFGHVTGRDPRSLGADEVAAFELGISREQAESLQGIAAEELVEGGITLAPFSPIKATVRRRID